MKGLAGGARFGVARTLALCTPAALVDSKKGVRKRPPAASLAVPQEPFFAACAEVTSAVAALEVALRTAFIRETDRAFEQEKRRRHALAFDDLLRRVHGGLVDPATGRHLVNAIRARYDVALIDEFQDTDALQYPIFSTAFSGHPLFLIGDPKQSIYGFRGADVHVYMRAAEDARESFTLSTNYRSTPTLISALNRLFGRATRPFLHDEKRLAYVAVTADDRAQDADNPLKDRAPALCWWLIEGDDRKPISNTKAHERFHEEIADEIVRLLEGRVKDLRREVLPREIAVLVRTNWEARALQRELSAAGVPSVLRGSGDILESEEMSELARILGAVVAPADPRAIRGALATAIWGKDARSFAALAEPHREAEWQQMTEDLGEARDIWRRHGFLRMAEGLLDKLGAAQRLLGYVDGERRLTNLRHAVEVLHAAEQSGRRSPEGLLLWLAQTRGTKATDAERRELRLESDAEAVQISTIHLSKGLEYGIVFCTSLWNPHKDKDGPVLARLDDETVVYDLGSEKLEEHRGLAAAEGLAEELRLTYVALTRAKYRCYVGLAATKDASPRSALGYLLLDEAVDPEPRHELVNRIREAVIRAMPRWQETLTTLCKDDDRSMSWKLLSEEGEELRFERAVPALAAASPRQLDLASDQLDTWRISSYTRLSRGATAHDDPRADEPEIGGHEVDEAAVAESAEARPSG
ncbi:MAG: UvrD-helicase domain-containing protein, partial [Actinomycetota bacterium]|nr:UvrD-helicase domain-containing protein [Actinomycetota bacterium]